MYRKASGKYRVRNVKEPHRIQGTGEKNRGRNCLKLAVGLFIMERSTAERGRPLFFFCFKS